MKKLISILYIFILLGCEKVIELETDFNDKRLVVDAYISKHKDSLNKKGFVKLSETIPYFSNEESMVDNAVVSIEINEKIQVLNYDSQKKEYIGDINFVDDNDEFILNIMHNNNNYTSNSRLIKTPKIESVVFGERKSLNKDEVELKITFTDPPEEGNYYLWKFGPKKSGKFDYLPALDKYINGNKFTFSFFIDKTEYLQNTDYITIEINGITEDYFNYLNILTSQAGAQNGRPFSTSSSVIKGNVINNTNLENFPLGYFRVYEFDYFRLPKEDAPDGYFD